MPGELGRTSFEQLVAGLDGNYNHPASLLAQHTGHTFDQSGTWEFQMEMDLVTQARDALGALIHAVENRQRGVTAENTQQVKDAVNAAEAKLAALINAIPPFPPEVIRAITDIADAQAFQAALQQEGPPVELIAAVDSLTATLADLAARAPNPGQQLIELLLPSVPDARTIVAASDVGQWQAVLGALPTVLKAIKVAEPVLVFRAIPIIMDFIRDHYPELGERIGGMGEQLGPLLMGGIEALHGPMKAVMETGVELFFHALQRELDGVGKTTPDNVLEIAAQLVTEAGAIGMSSHIVASIAEHFHPGKELGFPQLAAFLADLSDFKRVASETFGQHIAAALHSPARRRANAQFRPELPDGFAWAELFFGRHVSEQEFHEFYAQQGWIDEHIAGYREAIHRKASPRELALVFEDGDVDPAWALRMLQRGGFNDEDAALLLSGVRTRAIKGARQSFIAEVLANYEEGIYDEETTAGLLDKLRLGDETRQLLLLSSQHKRLRVEASKLRTVYETLAEQGSLPPEELQAVMNALGYDARAREMAGARVSAKLAGKAFHEAAKDEQAALRRAQTDNITALKEAYRRFEITFEQLVGGLLANGLRAEEATAIARVAAESVVPVPELPKVLTPARELQEAIRTETQAVLALLRNGDIGEDLAYTTLLSFGVPQQEARADVDLAAARLTFPAPSGGLELKTPAVRAAEAKAAAEEKAAARADAREHAKLATLEARAAEESFKAGELGPDELRAALVALGQSADAAQAVVDRLMADRVALQRARAVSEARADVTATENALRDAAVLAFRNGAIDETQLGIELLAAGVARAEAVAIVQRERARKKPTARTATVAPKPAPANPAPPRTPDQEQAPPGAEGA